VSSGAEGRGIWSSREPLEYETSKRLTPLGGLDGDDRSELAVLHPRMDRSAYDLDPLDALFGVHSWLSIASGARAIR
jgi:hypothetical protein